MFTVTLHRAGHVSEEATVYSLAEASATVRAFQRKWDMGASDMGDFHGEVRVAGQNGLRYTVSYNGRVWDLDPVGGPYVGVAYDPADEDTVRLSRARG